MEHAQTIELVTLCPCPSITIFFMKKVPKVMTIAIRLQARMYIAGKFKGLHDHGHL